MWLWWINTSYNVFVSITCTSKVIKFHSCTSSEFHHVYCVGSAHAGSAVLCARLRGERCVLNMVILSFFSSVKQNLSCFCLVGSTEKGWEWFLRAPGELCQAALQVQLIIKGPYRAGWEWTDFIHRYDLRTGRHPIARDLDGRQYLPPSNNRKSHHLRRSWVYFSQREREGDIWPLRSVFLFHLELLELSPTVSAEPSVHLSSQYHVQWHHISSLKVALWV